MFVPWVVLLAPRAVSQPDFTSSCEASVFEHWEELLCPSRGERTGCIHPALGSVTKAGDALCMNPDGCVILVITCCLQLCLKQCEIAEESTEWRGRVAAV